MTPDGDMYICISNCEPWSSFLKTTILKHVRTKCNNFSVGRVHWLSQPPYLEWTPTVHHLTFLFEIQFATGLEDSLLTSWMSVSGPQNLDPTLKAPMRPLTDISSNSCIMQQPASSKLPQVGPQKNKALRKKTQQAGGKDTLTSHTLHGHCLSYGTSGLDHSFLPRNMTTWPRYNFQINCLRRW